MVRLPDDSQHIAFIGRNGSGKTQAATDHLSTRSFDRMPWIIFDTKGDELLNEIHGTQEIDLSTVPKKPGLYITHPHPDDVEEIDAFFNKLWEHENVGIMVDEGYMIGMRPRAFNRILTQGRSKHLPVIILSQRPLWLTKFVWSECTFFRVFSLSTKDDRKKINNFFEFWAWDSLPEFYSVYHDVKAGQTKVLRPANDRVTILQRFRERLAAPKVHIL